MEGNPMQTPIVSVLMPVHNAGAYVEEAAESILNQTFPDFEFLIVDDGSSDDSLQRLKSLSRRDGRITLISRPRTGYVQALNELIDMARGEFFARMDADDVAHPGRLRQQLESMREHDDVVCLGSAFDIIDERGTRLNRLFPPTDNVDIQRQLLRGHTAIAHSAAMMRADAVRRVGAYDPAFTTVDDLDLFLRLGEVGLLANVPRALLRYRVHASSVSHVAGRAQRELAREVCQRAWERRCIPPAARIFDADEEWRPGPDRDSRHRFALRYGWWAFNSGERMAAIRYGARATALMPWRCAGWMLLASAVIKSRPWPPPPPAAQPLRHRPRISVLMPVYNAERFLAPAVESVLEQTLADFELIIVDDASTDDSPHLLRRYAQSDSRIRILAQERAGYVAALQYGLKQARGHYIARMDADDICDPARFELQIERLERDSTLAALGSCALAIDPQGRPLGAFDVPLDHEQIEAAHLAGVSSIHHPSVMMRREALQSVGGYRKDLAPAEDFDLWLRLGEYGRLANLPQRLIHKRLTLTGVVGSTFTLQQNVIHRALTDAWQRRGLEGEPPSLFQTFSSEADLYRQWGWMALRQQSLSTARLYAARSILREPLREASWRLAYCAVRGR
jgi:glycosyltransferase involved in cell wall biosynthesis